jgi:hypothetical protein
VTRAHYSWGVIFDYFANYIAVGTAFAFAVSLFAAFVFGGLPLP